MSLLNTFLKRPPQEEVLYAIGNKLYMKDDAVYKDFSGGFTGHSVIGWGNKNVAKKAYEQLSKIGHIDYKNFKDSNRTELGEILTSLSESGLEYAYFVGGSGGESCEAAIKLSYQSHVIRNKSSKMHYISRKQSYHGCSSDNLSLGDRPNLDLFKPFHSKYRSKIEEHNVYRQLLDNESIDEYTHRSLEQLKKEILSIGPQNIGGFIGETIMGGLVGDVPPTPDYWKGVRDICTQYDIHLILDEVWCGCGVSGKYFCHDWDTIKPDFVFFGKTLAAGYAPISALMTTEEIKAILSSSGGQIKHSTTFQGHSLSCAITLEVIKQIQENSWIENANQEGQWLRSNINETLKCSKYFKNVRGRGVRNSIEQCAPNQHLFSIEIGNRLRNLGFIISAKWHRVQILPNLNIKRDDLYDFLQIFYDEWFKLEKEWVFLDKDKIDEKPFF